MQAVKTSQSCPRIKLEERFTDTSFAVENGICRQWWRWSKCSFAAEELHIVECCVILKSLWGLYLGLETAYLAAVGPRAKAAPWQSITYQHSFIWASELDVVGCCVITCSLGLLCSQWKGDQVAFGANLEAGPGAPPEKKQMEKCLGSVSCWEMLPLLHHAALKLNTSLTQHPAAVRGPLLSPFVFLAFQRCTFLFIDTSSEKHQEVWVWIVMVLVETPRAAWAHVLWGIPAMCDRNKPDIQEGSQRWPLQQGQGLDQAVSKCMVRNPSKERL